MIALSYYLLKVILCSGILFGYYQLALKDKVFHQWNRFYLLGSVLVSVLLPILNISVYTPARHQSTIISAMEIVSGADEYVNEVHTGSLFAFTTEMLAGLAYTIVSLVVLLLFISALVKITSMIRRNQGVAIDDFVFLNTTEQGTPFSFFRFLLWNKEIPLDTENGRRILEHELVHIREKHSWDKIFIQLILVLFWVNPFFWLIRKELTLIHEFIADRKAVGNGDADAFARLLLEASFPGYAPMLSNTFFKTSIKRRLSMITKQENPGFTYLSRLMMIPVLMVLLFAFGVKAKTMLYDNKAPIALDQKLTVVIDAGHGGDDAGAMHGEIKEKDLNIRLAKLVAELNQNPNINIVLTRGADKKTSVQDRVKLAEDNKAKLFVSIHTASAPSEKESGITAFISGRDLSQYQQNVRLATLLLNNLSTVYNTDKTIKQRKEQGVWVLDKNVCPSVILECGYITNAADRKFLSAKKNQEKIARQILQSIEDYFSKTVFIQIEEPKVMTAALITTDSVPAKKLKNVTLTYEDGTKETMTPEEYRKKSRNKNFTVISDSVYAGQTTIQASRKMPDNVNYIVDGKITHATVVESLDPAKISSMSVNKSASEPNTITIVTKAAASAGTVSTTTKTSTTTLVSTEKPVVNGTFTINGTSGTITNKGDGPGIKIAMANGDQPMYVLNGEVITEEQMKAIDPNKIDAVNVLKGDDAEKSYGAKAKNGVVVITLKK